MPLLEIRKINTHTRLGRWALTESIAQLVQHADLPKHLVLPETLSHEKRQCEWLASRLLAYLVLQHFTPTNYELRSDANGKPFFTNSPYKISISHTQTQVAVLISDTYEVGIDIETVKPKILRIRDKFLAPLEKQHIGEDLNKLIIAWSAKETLYKLYSQKSIAFAENLLLSPFTVASTGIINATILTNTFERNYTIFFECAADIVLTFCLDDNLL